MNESRYTSVDDLQSQLSLPEAAARCGVPLDIHGGGKQVRLDCPFGCPGDHAGKREISVDTGNPQKVFCCHAYGCQVRGNLLSLMHGWLTGTQPTGGRLKGTEFKRVREVIAGSQTPAEVGQVTTGAVASSEKPADVIRNVPLAESSNEKAKELVTIDEKFVTDVAHMSPAAAVYVRRHPCLSHALMRKWRVGILPPDGGGDKRAWSLRGQLLYPVQSEDGQLLAWVARDPQFDMKEFAFNQLPPEQRTKEKKPPKHRFPVDFHRGQELFGQQSARLKEPGYRETISRCGIIVVEGFNDVMGLDALGIPAVGIMSNKITTGQVAKVERWARLLAEGKVTILFDADDAGDEGAKEAAWQLLQRGLDVRLGWSQEMHGGAFKGRQPETLKREEWERVIYSPIARASAITG
jgi:5S rRNA maturation endonuclease (ribonuclease M5)